MHIREMDFRRQWLKELFNGLKTAIQEIVLELDEVDWYDGLHAKEDSESVFGIAFVAAQIYITGTVSDLKEMVNCPKEIYKGSLLALDTRVIREGINAIQLIDAIANYFKHHDEWSDWRTTSKNKRTISMLNRSGITKDTEFPCYYAATLLWSEEEIGNFDNLLDILVCWRKNVLSKKDYSN